MSTPEEFATWLERWPGQVERFVAPAVDAGGQLLRTQIIANAGGRPGPNFPTGDYRGSWEVRPLPGPDIAVGIGTNRPQGRRLELGFTGTDSLGRTFNQPPFPHVAPAIQQKTRQIVDGIERAVARANDS